MWQKYNFVCVCVFTTPIFTHSGVSFDDREAAWSIKACTETFVGAHKWDTQTHYDYDFLRAVRSVLDKHFKRPVISLETSYEPEIDAGASFSQHRA